MMHQGTLQGRIALVTGGGRGIGRAISLGFAREGASVAISARSQNEIDSIVEEIHGMGGTSLAMQGDLGAPGTPIQGFDQDVWVVALHYNKRDPRKALDQFRVLREANLAMLKSLSPEQWKHHGVHSERGEESIETILSIADKRGAEPGSRCGAHGR